MMDGRAISLRLAPEGLVLVFVFVFALPGARAARQAPATEDDYRTRRARLCARRSEKSERIEPARISSLERAFLRFEEALSEPVPANTMSPIEESLQLVNENLGDLPYPSYRDRIFTRVGSVRSGGGLSAGIRFVRPDVANRETGIALDASAAFSANRYQLHRVRVGKMLPIMARTALLGPMLEAGEDPWFSYLDARYYDFREETLFRQVPGVSQAEDVHFRYRRSVLSGVMGYRGRRATVSARVGYSGNRVTPASEDGGSEDDGAVPLAALAAESFDVDSSPSMDFLELAASLQLDFRDVPRNARRGAFVELSVARFDDAGPTLGTAEAFEFVRLGVEAAGFLPLGSPQRTLALRGLLSTDQPGDGRTVPFYLQRALGGNETLRGFSDFRFRGNNLMHLTVEYRFRPASYWGLSAFWDTGQAFDSFAGGFDLDGFEHSFGLGSRIETPSSTVVRVQVARSREGTRFHIAMGMVF